MRNRIFIYAPTIAGEVEGTIPLVTGFREFYGAPAAARRLKPRANTLIFPHGGVTFPVV